MKKEAGAVRYVRRGIIAVGILLPTLSLVPFGSFWLWQNGYLLYWGAAAFAITAAAFAFQYWLLRSLSGARPPERESRKLEYGDPGEPAWSPREASAWRDVLDIAERVEIDELASRDAVLALGQTTVEAVARRLHPSVDDPLWRFTVPEALALVEQVSARMRPFIRDNIPLGDVLTVGQAIKLYRWSGLIDSANKAYDLWRIVRLVNPIGAAMSEARERFSKKMYEWGRDELARRLARAYVKEVGRAAIDLYGGRLSLSPDEIESTVTAATEAERAREMPQAGEPLRLFLGGQTGVGKSSLVNALSRETQAAVDVLPTTTGFKTYELAIEGVPSAVIVDSPAVGEPEDPLGELVAAASRGDLILWLVSAARADRNADRLALDAIRRHFASRPDRRPPAILVVATHIDRLRPFREWSPPYDLRDGTNEKAASIGAAVMAIATDLDAAPDEIVPVCLDPPESAYNVDALWARIVQALPEAKRTRLVRVVSELRARKDWRTVLKQAGNGGRVLMRTLAGK